jgi:hypothetical protein
VSLLVSNPTQDEERTFAGIIVPPSISRQIQKLDGRVQDVDPVLNRAWVTYPGETDSVSGHTWQSPYYPVIGDWVSIDVWGNNRVITGKVLQAGETPYQLADAVNNQQWSGLIGHGYTTSYQFVSGQQDLNFVKQHDGTRLIGGISASWRNATVSTVVYHALYLTDTADSVGRWEITRMFADVANNHASKSGEDYLGPAGEYAAGPHTINVAGKVLTNATVNTDSGDQWTTWVREVWE